jgi:hypothetical protein
LHQAGQHPETIPNFLVRFQLLVLPLVEYLFPGPSPERFPSLLLQLVELKKTTVVRPSQMTFDSPGPQAHLQCKCSYFAPCPSPVNMFSTQLRYSALAFGSSFNFFDPVPASINICLAKGCRTAIGYEARKMTIGMQVSKLP